MGSTNDLPRRIAVRSHVNPLLKFARREVRPLLPPEPKAALTGLARTRPPNQSHPFPPVAVRPLDVPPARAHHHFRLARIGAPAHRPEYGRFPLVMVSFDPCICPGLNDLPHMESLFRTILRVRGNAHGRSPVDTPSRLRQPGGPMTPPSLTSALFSIVRPKTRARGQPSSSCPAVGSEPIGLDRPRCM